MLLEQQETEVIITAYESYLNSGGRLTEQAYQLTLDVLYGEEDYPSRDCTTAQILHIAKACDIDVSQSQISAYNVLRNMMPCDEQSDVEIEPRATNVWSMSDQEIVQQIFFLTHTTNYQIITERYPNIFGE